MGIAIGVAGASWWWGLLAVFALVVLSELAAPHVRGPLLRFARDVNFFAGAALLAIATELVIGALVGWGWGVIAGLLVCAGAEVLFFWQMARSGPPQIDFFRVPLTAAGATVVLLIFLGVRTWWLWAVLAAPPAAVASFVLVSGRHLIALLYHWAGDEDEDEVEYHKSFPEK